METELSPAQARVLLEWQVELGAVDAVGDTALNRYEMPPEAPKPKPAATATTPLAKLPEVDAVAEARTAAEGAGDLAALEAAMAAYPHCELKRGAKNLVFADGIAGAGLMIVGEAPGRDEDIQGKPFVGRAGQLLDRMLAAIARGRSQADAPVYITNVLPWRPPQNRDPKPEEIAMLMPFLHRHIELAAPKVLIAMGNISCQALLGRRGITKMRGIWGDVLGLPVMPMFHPAYLLRQPAAKRDTWSDLLAVQAKLRDPG